jgi:glycosyltransferase involved in cell wall biosynthesis
VRLLYVTSSFPFGHGEGFLVEELRSLEREGHELTIVPTLARGPVVHDDARPFLDRTRNAPLLSRRVARAAARDVWEAPGLVAVVARSRSPRILAKNLSIVPKALWLTALARRLGVEHVHAHWAGTSGTLAMLASRASGIPWSLTVHRWDIREDNLLAAKAASASFVRAISDDGLRDLQRVAGPAAAQASVLHMGVALPEHVAPARREERPLRVLVPANLLEVKGHRHVVDAVALLGARGVPVFVGLAGQGELRAELEAQIARLGVGGECVLLGQLSHPELLAGLAAGEWDAVALPSVATPSGEKEGIPVAFLEAMSHGVPVVGTTAGAVPELLGDGAGMLVPPGDADALADALERLAREPELRAGLARAGRARVERDFSSAAIAAELSRRFEQARSGGSSRADRRRSGSRSGAA